MYLVIIFQQNKRVMTHQQRAEHPQPQTTVGNLIHSKYDKQKTNTNTIWRHALTCTGIPSLSGIAVTKATHVDSHNIEHGHTRATPCYSTVQHEKLSQLIIYKNTYTKSKIKHLPNSCHT